MLFVLGHEMTHFVRHWSPSKYQKLANFLVEEFSEKYGGETVDQLVHKKMKETKLEYDDAFEEVVADAMETMLTDGNLVEKLAKLKKQDKMTWQRLKDFVKEWHAKLKAAYEGLTPDSAEGQMVAAMVDSIDQLQQLFAEGLVEASENYKAGQDKGAREAEPAAMAASVRNQARPSVYDYSKPFGIQVDDWISGAFPMQDTLLVGGTPDVLIKIGFPSLPITITQTNLKANINGEYRGTPSEILDHVIASADFKRLPELIADPVAIIADRRLQHNQWTVSEHVVDVLVEMEINGKQTLVPIKIDGKGMQHGATIDAFSISSVHGNRDAYDRLNYALANDSNDNILAFYVNKNKATAVLQKAGYTITGWPNNSNGFIHSITDPQSPVKLRITSQTETRQFKKWFKGSVVVNADGTPMEMYHGTSNYGFNVFNTYGGKFGLFGKGSYFTDNPEIAESYTKKGKGQNPGVYGVYLNIKNPLDMDAKADVNAWRKAFDNADLDLSYLDGITTNEDAFRALKENLQDEGYVRWEAEEIVTDLIEGMGYDGITHIGGGRYGSKDGPKHRVFIAFNPEQIKSSTDNIGTFDGSNPDIRYQNRGTDSVSNRSLLANALESATVNDKERQKLQEYKEKIGEIQATEEKLRELNAQIRELSFGEGTRDQKKIFDLRLEAKTVETVYRIASKSRLSNPMSSPHHKKPLSEGLAKR